MCGKHKFFRCELCGNMIGMVLDEGPVVVCCGKPMTELVPNTVEAAVEKHLPVVTSEGNSVTVAVGSVPHPMEDAHHISFVYIATENGGQRKCLAVGDEPRASFAFVDDKPIAAYAYCNLHGLWKTEIN